MPTVGREEWAGYEVDLNLRAYYVGVGTGYKIEPNPVS